MGLLTKEQILAAQDARTEEVEVPEWGGTVRVRSMSGADRDAWEQWCFNQRSGGKEVEVRNLRARLVALCVVDAEGKRMFADADIEALGAKDARPLDRVYDVAQSVNALGAAQVEDLAKN